MPVLQCGSDRPKILIINNMHGDEVSGFYILEKLISLLPEKFSGALTIVPSANPLGLIHRQRFVPLDEEDLNRGYPPPPKARGVSAAYRHALIQLGLTHDFIIDLHTFARPCLDAGLFLSQSSEKNTILVRRFLQELGPETVFSMDIKGEEKREASAFGVYMIAQGKPFVAIEYPPVRQMNDEPVAHHANNLLRALSSLNNIPSPSSIPSKEIPLFERQQIISQYTGLFAPTRKLRDEIKINDIIGFMIDSVSLVREEIRSPYQGILTEIADRQLWRFGEKLATIGKRAG